MRGTKDYPNHWPSLTFWLTEETLSLYHFNSSVILLQGSLLE